MHPPLGSDVFAPHQQQEGATLCHHRRRLSSALLAAVTLFFARLLDNTQFIALSTHCGIQFAFCRDTFLCRAAIVCAGVSMGIGAQCINSLGMTEVIYLLCQLDCATDGCV
jgi:hypothetical protein